MAYKLKSCGSELELESLHKGRPPRLYHVAWSAGDTGRDFRFVISLIFSSIEPIRVRWSSRYILDAIYMCGD